MRLKREGQMGLLSFHGLASNSLLSNSHFWTTVFKKISELIHQETASREGRKEDTVPSAYWHVISYPTHFQTHGLSVLFKQWGKMYLGHTARSVTLGKALPNELPDVF